MTTPSFKEMLSTARRDGTYAMQKAVSQEVYRQRFWPDYGSPSPKYWGLIDSEQMRKAVVLGSPDYRTFGMMDRRNKALYGEDEMKARADDLLRYLKENHPERILGEVDDPRYKHIAPSPWANSMRTKNPDAPNATATPQDYFGYLIHPGDPMKYLDVPDTDEKDLHHKFMQHRPDIIGEGLDGYKGFGIRDGAFDVGNGINRGFLERPKNSSTLLINPDNGIDQVGYNYNVRNADIAFENGKKMGVNGPNTEKKVIGLLSDQLNNALNSSDSDTRRAAEMLNKYLKYLHTIWYNPQEYYNNKGVVSLGAPVQELLDWGGWPGATFWEEVTHGADNTVGSNRAGKGDYLSRQISIHNLLAHDFADRFQNDPDKIVETGENVISGWDKGKGRYPDNYEYLELLNHMYNIATGGENAPGVLRQYGNHLINDESNPWHSARHWLSNVEPYNSLTNNRMTGHKDSVDRIARDFPNANKGAKDSYKIANDFYDDTEKRTGDTPKFSLDRHNKYYRGLQDSEGDE